MERPCKTLVIGLDGVGFALIAPWLESCKMPTLKRLISEGISTKLVSILPYNSAAAWTSMTTGLNPGRHGMFDFFVRSKANYEIELVDSRQVKASTVWHMLSQSGKKVCVVNVPATYPPQPVNGVLVGGMLTPSTHSSFTYPDPLKYELDNVCHGYEIDIEPRAAFGDQVKYDLLVNDLKRILAKRLKATLFLLTTHEWDFFMVVFTETDRIQHFLWGFNDPRHPNYTRPRAAKCRQLLLDFFVHVDEAVDTIIQAIPDHTNVFVVSDHGFAAEHTRIYMPSWLSQKGLFSLPPELGTGHASRNPHSWLTTKAYPGAASSKGIYINLKGRERNGVVEPGAEYNALRSFLMEELTDLTDPQTNRRVVKRVVKKEDIYWGEYVELAPDLLVETDGYALSSRIGECGVFEPLKVRSGGHAKDGLFIAWGPTIQEGEKIIRSNEVKIVDIAPTLLYLLGVSPPHLLDGHMIPGVTNTEMVPHQPKEVPKRD